MKVATPLPFKATGGLMLTPPNLNSTDPVGVPAEELTVAVKVTDSPTSEGVTDVLTDVLVKAFTVAVLVTISKFPLVSAI
jgi:hypothetical protein